MTDTTGTRSRLSMARVWPGLALAAGLTLASGVSLVHLANAWTAAAPIRAQRAADAQARVQTEADARRARETAEARAATAVEAAASAVIAAPRAPGEDIRLEDLPPEVRAAIERRGGLDAADEAGRRGPATVVNQPVRWLQRPNFDLGGRSLNTSASRVAVRFTCTLGVDGGLSACRAVETPPGSGLAALATPSVTRARAEPMQIDGRPVSSTLSFTMTWDRAPAPAVEEPSPRAWEGVAAQPAEAPTTVDDVIPDPAQPGEPGAD